MAFNYITSSKLDSSTEQLLEEIDNFPYNRLKPYSKLGDIHAQLTVEVVDDIPVRKRTIILTLGELKKQLEEIKKRNEEIRKIREDELQKNLEDEKDEMKRREAMSMREFLPNEISTMNLEEVLNEHSDDPDTTEVSLPINERIDGYYTRDHNNKGLIVLASRGRSEQTIAMTYVHELMHAYYDCGCNGSMNDIEYVEEPFAELGMLRFMEQFHFSNPAFQNLFNHCYFSVKNKQNSIGFVHYGFGAELFDCYNGIFQEECMMKRHTFDKNALGSLTRYYQEIKDILKLSWPNDKDRHTVAQNISILLKNDARFWLNKPNTCNSWFPYVFFFRSIAYGSEKDMKNIKLGERVLISKYEWITEQSRIGIFVDRNTWRLISMLSELQNSLQGIITKVCEDYCEVECYIRPYVHIDCFFLNNSFLAVNIPAFCDGIYIDESFDSEHNQLQITVDSNNISFEFDKKNLVLVDKRYDTLVLGYSNSKIPDSIRKIGRRAFSRRSKLKQINIPNSVTEIGSSAFEGCTGLTSITIPDSVTEIRYAAFAGCTGLTSIVIPDGVAKIGEWAFFGCTGLTSIVIPDSVTEIGGRAFYGCTGLTSITIPDNVTKIGSGAFLHCTSLTSITIPDGVKVIGDCAFKGCPNLQEAVSHICSNNGKRLLYVPKNITEFNIPDGVTEIGSSAFEGCTGLTSINIPDSVTEIRYAAFRGCTGLTSINIPDSVTEIGSSAFKGCTGLTSITIPDSVTEIGSSAFEGCTGLTSITIPDSVTEIGEGAFEDCPNLKKAFSQIYSNNGKRLLYVPKDITKFNIPNTVTEIGGYAFSGCTSLTSINIPYGVTAIGNYTFKYCKSLTSITIPDSVTEIGEWAFFDCTGLTSIDIPNSVTKIGECAFFDCTGLISINIPDSVTEIGSSAFKGCTGLTSITIPDSVTEIGEWAFFGCTGLTSITIPDNVTKIGESAFRGCTGLISINIPNSVTEIGSSAFEGCTGLTSIVIPDSVTEICEDAFKECTKLINVSIPGHLKSKDLRRAFKGCELLKVTIRDDNSKDSKTENK